MQVWEQQRAVQLLREGRVIAYPTEAVWGLGCDPYNRRAVAHLLSIKRRSVHKGLILIAANAGIVEEAFPWLTPKELQRMLDVSEPTSWLLPHHNAMPWWVTGHHSLVAVRISRHTICQQLCNAFGGMLVSTSANPSGMKPAYTALKSRCYFGSGVDLYVSGELGSETKPSAIVELQTGHVLRQ